MSRKRRNPPHVQLVATSAPAEASFGAGHPVEQSRSRARIVVVTSGKGGAGKSNVAANLAVAMGERGARVLLVDGDLAQANLDLLMGLHPRWDVSHVLSGQKTLDEVIVNGTENVRLVPAASGDPDLAELDDYRRESLLRAIGTVEDADIVVIDTASGLSRQNLAFCRAAHDVLVVTTPEMTSFSDAYALVKLLQQQGGPFSPPRLIINQANGADEAEETAQRLQLVARRFLRLELDCLGVIPEDSCVPRAVRLQEPVVQAFPQSPAAIALRALAAKLWKGSPSGPVSDVAPVRQRLEA